MTDSAPEKSHTSSSALLGALLYIAARKADWSPDSTADAPRLKPNDRDILAEVEAVLAAQHPDQTETVATILAEVAPAIAYIRSSVEAPSLSAAKYDSLRTEVFDRLGTRSVKGATVWPPTSQTAVQRFGSWNQALKAAGLATSRIGRAKGQLRFDAAAYDKALAAFVADCESRGVSATYKAYVEYAAEHKGEVPSAAAVRKFYGSWNTALAAVE